MYSVEDYLKDLNEMVKEAVKDGDCCDVSVNKVSFEEDDVPYGETTVKGPGYITDIEGEITFGSEPILTKEELEEYFDEYYSQAKEYLEKYRNHEDYSIEVDLDGDYEGDSIEIPGVTIQYKIDNNGNVVSKNENIQIKY